MGRERTERVRDARLRIRLKGEQQREMNKNKGDLRVVKGDQDIEKG